MKIYYLRKELLQFRIAYAQSLRVMKLTTALLLMAFVHCYASGTAQSITLSKKSVPLDYVFRELNRQTGVEFVYDIQMIKKGNNVDINVKNATLADVLKVCFATQPFSYIMEGNTVILKEKELSVKKEVQTNKEDIASKVKGLIKDELGKPFSGVTVINKESGAGTSTGTDGTFTIEANVGDILEFSFVGYKKETYAVKTIQKVIELDLSIEIAENAAIVVIGYGTQKKSEVTASVASVKKEDFNKGYMKDAAQLIQGKAAGVNIALPSGDPLSGSQIYIRGRQSLFAGEDGALILVDGVPSSLSLIAPEDIESVDILKDGAASAIYGVRGSNGVILITTKKAKASNKVSVEYTTYATAENFYKTLPFLTAGQYRDKLAQNMFFKGEDLGASTDWLGEISRTAVSNVHNLTFNGGSTNSNYMANINYRMLEGSFLKSDLNNLKIHLETNQTLFNGIVKVNIGGLINRNKYFFLSDNSGFTQEYNGYDYAYRTAIIRNPTAPIKDPADPERWSGNYATQGYFNPIGWIKETDAKASNQETRTYGNITITPVKGLRLNALLSRTQFNEIRGFYQTQNHPWSVSGNIAGYASRVSSEYIENLMELTAEFTKTINKHSIKGIAGYSYQDRDEQGFSGRTRDFINDNFSYNILQNASGIGQFPFPLNSSRVNTNLIGFFGRLNYSYNDKYFLMASIRREASSKLVGADEPWGNFPAVSAGWNLGNEMFMKDLKFLSSLKLRASYGLTGAAPKAAFLALQKYSWNYILNPATNTLIPSLQFTSNPNQKLKWEQKSEVNFGLDFGLFSNRITGSIDYYNRTTTGLLYFFPVSPAANLLPNTWANAGKITNKGLEIIINATPVTNKDFVWNTSFNFARNTNNVLSIKSDVNKDTAISFFFTGTTGEPIQLPTHRVEVGQPLGNFYGFKVIDIDTSGNWIYEGKDGKPITGSLRTPDDRKVLGNGIPKVILGWNNSFRYKKFDLNFYLRGALGFQILNAPRMFYENRKTDKHRNVLISSFDKVFGKTVISKTADPDYNSYYIENGDYFKLSNITLGYNFKFKGINSARIYISSNNTLIFSGYKGVDPEVDLYGNGLTPGVDPRDHYPTTRTVTLGVNVNF